MMLSCLPFASKNVVAEDMMVAAGEALYAAKQAGRNQYRMELLSPDSAPAERQNS